MNFRRPSEDQGIFEVRLTDMMTNSEIHRIELEVVPEFPAAVQVILKSIIGGVVISGRARLLK